MGSLTSLLNNESLQAALEDKNLQTLLYQELRVIAHAKLRGHSKHNELDTTSLVHEAYLKLNQNAENNQWSNRRHFYATAALAMRHILVDVARQKVADKRSHQKSDVTLSELGSQLHIECSQVVALNEALEQLKSVDADLVEVVNLRYFVGMTVAETAEILGVSSRSVDRIWHKAKALLKAMIND